MRTCFVALFAVLLCVVPVSAQSQEILIEHPPIYQLGEHHSSVIHFADTGLSVERQEMVHRGTDGGAYLSAKDVTLDGTVLYQEESNMTTGTGSFQIAGNTWMILSTTCEHSLVVPIYAGKKYDCSSLVRYPNGSEVWKHNRVEVTGASRDARGKIISVCDSDVSDDGSIYECWTPDGKWPMFRVISRN